MLCKHIKAISHVCICVVESEPTTSIRSSKALHFGFDGFLSFSPFEKVVSKSNILLTTTTHHHLQWFFFLCFFPAQHASLSTFTPHSSSFVRLVVNNLCWGSFLQKYHSFTITNVTTAGDNVSSIQFVVVVYMLFTNCLYLPVADRKQNIFLLCKRKIIASRATDYETNILQVNLLSGQILTREKNFFWQEKKYGAIAQL